MAAATSHLDHVKPDSRVGLPGEMRRKINVTMIGAGSFFTNSILKEVLLIPGSQGGELRLVDIDGDRLELTRKLMHKIVEEAGESDKWVIRASTDRTELLPGTDYIVNAIEVSGLDCVRADNDIPLQYGVSQNIGDTIGPGGLFKSLRTIPVWIDILQDCERLCPNVLVLNYTNPMNMMCLAAHRTSSIEIVGLCHSVQGTSELLSRYAGVPYKEMKWRCAGINHLAWFTELRGPDGKDLYPGLFEQARDRSSDFAVAEPVRTDMMLHFGAFITESSGHLSEYVPYYRKRKDLLEKYTDTGYRGEESFYANNWPNWRRSQDETRGKQLDGSEPIKLQRSHEYGAWIIEAVEKHSPTVIYGNVANQGLIENLPADGCVEVACLVDRNRIQPTRFGRLPRQMAAICDGDMRMFDLAVEAVIHRSKEMAAQALMLDPFTAAVCCPAEIREMTMKLFNAEAEFLPDYR
ncbi:MAG TPA: alpha-glucosidase/alpha-galactosidase [Fimbriimonadaceae bacterium]|nr:alpha-glucosidase/alpha-galactosidase [Fimbriimonadaceae bacterium]